MKPDFYRLYPKEFQDLLELDIKGENSYIGQGNPASEILIVGKECTTSDYAFNNNALIWKTKSPENIPNWFEARSWDAYHPRRPFYGQLYVKDNNSSKHPKTWDELNKGTSVTWKAQQRFINYFLSESQRVWAREQIINFYEYCFMTDLSCKCMKVSRKNIETGESIKNRLSPEGILTQPFFRKFPVVIFDIYHYLDWYRDIPIIQNFDGGVLNYRYKGIITSENIYSQYDDETQKRMPLYRVNNHFQKGDFINVHESADGKHILLHTSHFVDNYHPRSEDWMRELAETIRPYITMKL